jgi:hypothetical protein
MAKYMVGIDGSANGKNAFDTAVNLLNRKEDVLYIITVTESLPFDIGPLHGVNKKIERVQKVFFSFFFLQY